MVAPIIMPVVMLVPTVMAAMFSADVMPVNPMMPRPVAGDPNHFPVARPIAGAMAVIGPVADLNAEALSANSGSRKKNAGPNQGDEQKFIFNHTLLIRLGR